MNEKTKIKIIRLGHIDKIINFEIINNISSELFTITENINIPNLPASNGNSHSLNIVYSIEEVHSILDNIQFDGLCIALMDYRFNDNFYMHRIDFNKVCISITGVEEILQRKNISLENFILKNIYEIISLYQHFSASLPEEIYEFVHSDTRGCLFDLNGDKLDIIYNTENPKICNDCRNKLNQKKMINIDVLEKELLSIKKPLITFIELFIKENPLTSMAITFLVSIPINLLSSYIWSKIIG